MSPLHSSVLAREVKAIRLGLSLTCCLWVHLVQAADPPVQAVLIRTAILKGHVKAHQVRLTLVNQHERPVWFIVPYFGDDPIPANGVFRYRNWKPEPGWGDQRFGGMPIKATQGWAVEVTIQNEDFVRAFHVPAKRRIILEDYEIYASGGKDLRKIEVLEARNLKVNGKTPLEKWLPYDTMYGDKEPVDPVGASDNLDWDKNRSRPRDDYPKEKVEKVVADGIHHWKATLR